MKTLSVRFEETPDQEIVLRLSPVPTRELLAVMDRMGELYLTRESVGELAALFVPYVVSWTLPVPIDADGLLGLDFNEFYVLVNTWVSGVRDAPPPLLVASGDGVPSPAQPGSTSPSSSAEPSSSTPS